MATAPAGSDKQRWVVPFVGGLLVGGAAVYLTLDARWRRVAEESESRRVMTAVLERLAELERPQARDPADESGVSSVTSSPSESLAGKPVDATSAASRRRTGVDQSTMARAIERADRISAAIGAGEAAPAPLVVTDDVPTSTEVNAAAVVDREAERERLEQEAAAATTTAFNQLLADAGLDGWHLMAARPDAANHCLADVVLAQRGVRGTGIGSLIAKTLRLERDPITGIAALDAQGAHGVEGGVDVAYEGSCYRLEIPGVLPVELVPPLLRELFQLDDPRATAMITDGDSAVALVNRALALEKSLVMRLRSSGELVDGALSKAVIDLAFDSTGAPTQTVLADLAWFEVDPTHRYGELCCEGGEMVEGGQKRPLFRGRLRVALRDLTPEHWQGVPAVRRSTGS